MIKTCQASRIPYVQVKAGLQPRAALVHPADEERRKHERRQHLEQLRQPPEAAHNTTASNTTSVMKLYMR